MKVLGADIVEIFLQHAQKFYATNQKRFIRRVIRTDAAAILVHDLFKPLKPMDGKEIAWRNSARDDLVAPHPIGFQRLVDGLLQALIFRFADFGLVLAHIVHIFDGSLSGDAPLSERTGGEFVSASANRVACAE